MVTGNVWFLMLCSFRTFEDETLLLYTVTLIHISLKQSKIDDLWDSLQVSFYLKHLEVLEGGKKHNLMSELVENIDKGPSDSLDPPSYCWMVETRKMGDFMHSNLLGHLWLTFSLVNRI